MGWMLIVIVPPGLDLLAGVVQTQEPAFAQTLPVKPTVE